MTREVHCADALDWLEFRRASSIITSPPDASEIGVGIAEWESWFWSAVGSCLISSDGPVVFYVTDRKAGGRLRSKAALILRVAASVGASLAWHKIALRRQPGGIDLHRPGYSHLLAFNGRPGKATADVFDRGPVAYANGTGANAARIAAAWVATQADAIVDPFCGHGTILAAAEEVGRHAIGVDIDPAQCERARTYVLPR